MCGEWEILDCIHCRKHITYRGNACDFFNLNFYLLLSSLTLISLIVVSARTVGVRPGRVRNMTLHPLQNILIFKLWVYIILCSLVLIFMLVGLLAPAGPPGTPREPPGAHLTMFDKYVKKCKTWKMLFWGLLDGNCTISVGFIGVFEEP